MDELNRIEIAPAPTVAPEGHDAKMAELAANVQVNQDPEGLVDQSRPAWLPAEFNTPEEFAAAYSAMKSGTPSQETKTETPVETPATTTETPKASEDVGKVLESKGLDLNEFSKEFGEKGALSNESYDKLAKAGFSKEVVDSYVAGQQALATQYANAVTAEVGGAEKYADMISWAKTSLSPAEITAFNAAIDSGDVSKAKLAVLGLNAQFSKAVGSDPKLVSGRPVSANSDVFESTAQVVAAMANPLYKTDPAYRAKVSQKLARSNVL